MTSLRFPFPKSFKNSKKTAHQLYVCCQGLSAFRLSSSGPKTVSKDCHLDINVVRITEPKGDASLVQCSEKFMCNALNGFVPRVKIRTKSLGLCQISPRSYPGITESSAKCQSGSTALRSLSTLPKSEVEKCATGGQMGTQIHKVMGNHPVRYSGKPIVRGFLLNRCIYETPKCLGFHVRRSNSWAHDLSVSCRSFSSEPKDEQMVVTERLVTREDVEAFARLTGDTNPVHFSGKAIVHGALLNSFLSGVIGTKLPGSGTILVSQTFKFPHPCHIDDVIIIQVSIADVRKISVCRYLISRKSDNKCLMEGEAKVIVRKDFGGTTIH